MSIGICCMSIRGLNDYARLTVCVLKRGGNVRHNGEDAAAPPRVCASREALYAKKNRYTVYFTAVRIVGMFYGNVGGFVVTSRYGESQVRLRQAQREDLSPGLQG